MHSRQLSQTFVSDSEGHWTANQWPMQQTGHKNTQIAYRECHSKSLGEPLKNIYDFHTKTLYFHTKMASKRPTNWLIWSRKSPNNRGCSIYRQLVQKSQIWLFYGSQILFKIIGDIFVSGLNIIRILLLFRRANTQMLSEYSPTVRSSQYAARRPFSQWCLDVNIAKLKSHFLLIQCGRCITIDISK